MLRIWLNRTYSTHVHTVGMLRANPDNEPVHVIASHADPFSPVMTTADATEAEPDSSLSPAEYVEWALDLCRRHQVDVFWPRLRLAEIAASRHLFTERGIGLV